MEKLKPVYDKLNWKTRFIPFLLIVLISAGYFALIYATGHEFHDLLGLMFLVYFPMTLGALIAYFMQLTTHSRTGTHSVLFSALFISFLISIAIFQEGSICIVIASPILYFMMWVGAEIMHAICKHLWQSKTMLSIALVPFMAIFMPQEARLYDAHKTYEIVINASPETVWQSINNISAITPDEFPNSWSARIGVPMPLSATTVPSAESPVGLVRKCQWHKDIWFDEPITEIIPNQRLAWYFKFYPNSVPSGALDDHVTINGPHFKLLTASYDLEQLGEQQTKLTFNVNYQVITELNWYAGWWADFFMDDFAENVLLLYKHRLES